MEIINSNPYYDGFRMPGEFEAHSRSWMLWPERTDNWRLNAKPAQEIFKEVALAISKFEPVRMGVSKKEYERARKILPNNIEVFEIANDDSWARDNGPIFIKNNKEIVRGVDWEFNAWGGNIYSSWKQDELVAQKIIDIEGLDYYKANMVLEGGAIIVDGEGTLITTESCLLNKNRNKEISKEKAEKYFKKYLGIEKVIWLKEGVYMDETDGHVDNLCVFARPGEVVLLWTDDKLDPQYKISYNANEILRSSKDAKGRKLKIHKIHQPSPIFRTKEDMDGIKIKEGTVPRRQGERLPASYINLYLVNGGVIMPFFGDKIFDYKAMDELSKIFFDREIIPINSREIILGGGGIHCITQQIP